MDSSPDSTHTQTRGVGRPLARPPDSGATRVAQMDTWGPHITPSTNQNEKAFSGGNPPLNGWNSLPSNAPGSWPDLPAAGPRCRVGHSRTKETARPAPEG